MASGKPPLPLWKDLNLVAFTQFRNFYNGVVFNGTYRDSYELKIRELRLLWVCLPNFLQLADIRLQRIIPCNLSVIPLCHSVCLDSDIRLSRDAKSLTPAFTCR